MTATSSPRRPREPERNRPSTSPTRLSGSPTLGRFDSGAAPSGRRRFLERARATGHGEAVVEASSAGRRPEPPRRVADRGAQVAGSRRVRPISTSSESTLAHAKRSVAGRQSPSGVAVAGRPSDGRRLERSFSVSSSVSSSGSSPDWGPRSSLTRTGISWSCFPTTGKLLRPRAMIISPWESRSFASQLELVHRTDDQRSVRSFATP